MNSALRSITAIVLGFIAGFLIFFAVEYASIRIYPLPAGSEFLEFCVTDCGPNVPSRRRHDYRSLPDGSWETSIASFVSTKLAQDMKSLYGLILGLVFVAEGILKMREVPRPLWFWIAGVPLLVIRAILGTIAALPPRAENR